MIGLPMTGTQENAEPTGSVSGSSGTVIPNAQGTIANTGTGESHSPTGNRAGHEVFSCLNHAIYTLKVEARAFILSLLIPSATQT